VLSATKDTSTANPRTAYVDYISMTVCYSASCVDADGDGYYANTQGGSCGTVADCNDNNADVHPGATETCNGIDDNCIGGVDEGFNVGTTCQSSANSCDDTNSGTLVCKVDHSGSECSVGTPAERTNWNQNCESAPNSCGDKNTGKTDCNGACQEPTPAERAGYGDTCQSAANNCGATNPGSIQCDGTCSAQKPADGVLNTYYRDSDEDSYGTSADTKEACSTPTGYVLIGGDCNDNDAAVNPGATETCDGVDNDCDANTADGSDESWFNEGTKCGTGACAASGKYVCGSGVKTDTCAAGTPAEETCNNVDDDCDGSTDEDLTQETTCGVGACTGNKGTETCTEGVWGGDSCDAFAGATKESCDDLDNDCDGQADEENVCSPEVIENPDEGGSIDFGPVETGGNGNKFEDSENVWIIGKGWDCESNTVNVEITKDQTWTDGTTGAVVVKTFQKDLVNHKFTAEWKAADTTKGKYDVLAECDGNGNVVNTYEPAKGDVVDGITIEGFEVLPELLTSILLVAGLVSMVAYTAISRK
jgi:hypothetical protein